MLAPGVHHGAALFKHVLPRIGRALLVLVGMGKRQFRQRVGVAGREAPPLERRAEAVLRPANILSTTSDALPALGIIAAVLGVIKTMAAINESPAVLGAMLGSALVGTFLGVLLAYGLVGPIAERIRNMVEEELEYYEVIRAVFVAYLQGVVPQVAVEVGRKTVPTQFMPTFDVLEATLLEARGADSGMRSSDTGGSSAAPTREAAAA